MNCPTTVLVSLCLAALSDSASTQDLPTPSEWRRAATAVDVEKKNGSFTVEFLYSSDPRVRYLRLRDEDQDGRITREIRRLVADTMIRECSWLCHPVQDCKLVLHLRDRYPGSSTSSLELAYYLVRSTPSQRTAMAMGQGSRIDLGTQAIERKWRQRNMQDPSLVPTLPEKILELVTKRLSEPADRDPNKHSFRQELADEVSLADEVHLLREGKAWQCVLPFTFHVLNVSRSSRPAAEFRVIFGSVRCETCIGTNSESDLGPPFERGVVLSVDDKIPDDVTAGLKTNSVSVYFKPQFDPKTRSGAGSAGSRPHRAADDFPKRGD